MWTALTSVSHPLGKFCVLITVSFQLGQVLLWTQWLNWLLTKLSKFWPVVSTEKADAQKKVRGNKSLHIVPRIKRWCPLLFGKSFFVPFQRFCWYLIFSFYDAFFEWRCSTCLGLFASGLLKSRLCGLQSVCIIWMKSVFVRGLFLDHPIR